MSKVTLQNLLVPSGLNRGYPSGLNRGYPDLKHSSLDCWIVAPMTD